MTHQNLEGLTRREFLIGSSALGLQACAGVTGPSSSTSWGAPRIINDYYNEAPIDLSDVLDNPATNVINRWSPNLLPHSPDWVGHYYRPGYVEAKGLPGVDYAPASAGYTEITPVAAGIVTKVDYSDKSGWLMDIFHGGFFFSQYKHLHEKPYAEKGELINRNTIIALMGNTGDWARGIEHLHLNSFINTDIATKLKLHHLLEQPLIIAPAPINVDAQEFSILGRHRDLPYQISEDLKLDEQFKANLVKARNYVDDIFKEFYPDLWKFRRRVSYDNPYADTDLANDIALLHRDVISVLSGGNYLVIKEGKLAAFKSKARIINAELERVIKSLVPRFSAPIREPGRDKAKYYDYSIKNRLRR